MSYNIETVSEEGHEDYEVWTCKNCGRTTCLSGTGGDIACCPCEFENEGDKE